MIYEWSISGLAWVNVDSTCRLHYKVRLNAGEKATEAKILLQDHPMQNLKVGTYTISLQNSILCIEKVGLHTYWEKLHKTYNRPNRQWNHRVLKVSKSQKHFFLKLHCPKTEQNIRQNSALVFKKWLNKTIEFPFSC
jgi:hypothetical protein